MSNVFRGVEGTVPAELAGLHVDDLTRERDQARSLACEYASRLARVGELLSPEYRGVQDLHERIQAALAVASGAAVEVPLRVLVEWALRGREWKPMPYGYLRDPLDGNGWKVGQAVRRQIAREEAAPAAEAST